ncbi:MAG: hercynine oxygenase [Gemmatimonadales bacterium]|nr:MAG: hercynine oxygenase [Gemmatimonadales bacterium]
MTAVMISADQLIDWVCDARQRTLDLVADLTDEQLIGPRLPIINPLLWEIGHVAWFQEIWVLRRTCGLPPILKEADSLWDSIAVAHDIRWDLHLPSREKTLKYLTDVRDRVVEILSTRDPEPALVYHVMYTVFHEDMHTEAFTYTRQTLGYPPPQFRDGNAPSGEFLERRLDSKDVGGDVAIEGGRFMLGADPAEPFVFDNEKWAHEVELAPFLISRTPVTQRQFADFVDDGGYRRQEFWSEEGWRWRAETKAEHPVYWRREEPGRWWRRHFDRWVPLEDNLPVIHVNWYEAEAYCRWAGRRLPTEAEWEAAAATDGKALSLKRRFPWGDDPPSPDRVNMDWSAMGCVDVRALGSGDSSCGCRQMLGNVWEWTATTFLPYPGFQPDPYKEYSEPWFGTRKVLRGGAWATRSRMLRNTWRNFFTPDRRDVFAGFRTCALER